MKYFLILLLAAVLGGCISTDARFEPNLVGLTGEEVAESWGEPLKKEKLSDGGERWTYRMKRIVKVTESEESMSAEYLPYSREPEEYVETVSFSTTTEPVYYDGVIEISAEGMVTTATPGTPIQ